MWIRTTLVIAAVLSLLAPTLASAQDGAGSGEAAPAAEATGGGTIAGTVTASRANLVPNTLVYVVEAPGEFPPPAEPIQMDQRDMAFQPFILPILRGTTVRYLNNDPTEHNVFSPDNETFNMGNWGQGESREHVYENLGVYSQLCQLHPQMLAFVAVMQNPYFAVVGDDGTFNIANVPPGTYSVAVFNERKEAAPQEVTVTEGGTTTISIALE
jgi:plastocyanin